MAEPAFTPGPWEADEEWGLHAVADKDGGLVAMLFEAPMIGGSGKPFRHAEANARLIAAAPALYDALLKVQRAFRERTLLNPDLPLDVDAALSLALGEKQDA